MTISFSVRGSVASAGDFREGVASHEKGILETLSVSVRGLVAGAGDFREEFA